MCSYGYQGTANIAYSTNSDIDVCMQDALMPELNTNVVTPVKTKYVLYARKSTESEERQVLSIDSQIKEMMEMAERENLDIVEVRREAHSAKASGQRPVFKEILHLLRKSCLTKCRNNSKAMNLRPDKKKSLPLRS